MKIKQITEKECGTGEITMKYAEDTFNELLAFQGYGFCSAHALCYGVYSAVQLWLQEHYFIDYMSILLNHIHRGDKDKKTGGSVIDERIRYCIENGVSIRYPNVNKSTDKWKIINGATLLCPLINIKGFSVSDNDLIIKNRPYDSICDFMDKNQFGKGKFEALLFSNAFSDFGDVETLYNWYYNEYTNKSKKKKNNDSFFDFGDGFNEEPVTDMKQVHFSKSELDDASFEYNGFIIDDNMLAKYADIYKTGLKYFFEGKNNRILSISVAVKESLEPKKGHEDDDDNSKERFVLAKLRSKEMVTTRRYSYCLMNFTDGRNYLSIREYNKSNYEQFQKGHEYLVPIWFSNGRPSINGHFIEKNDLIDLENVKK